MSYFDKILPIVLIFLFSYPELSNAQVNQRLVNNKTGEEILFGICTREAFEMKPFYEWYNREYNSYKYLINRRLLDTIKTDLNQLKIKIVLGTWCHDSRTQVPRFLGILDHVKFDYKNVTFICVDQNKDAGSISTSELGIIKVPTFIFYKNEEEVGRIIETPTETLEMDILKILKNPQPKQIQNEH